VFGKRGDALLPISSMYAPNLAAVCIDRFNEQDAAGRIYSRISEEPINFSSILQMIEHMDHYYDRVNFPQAANEIRSFNRNANKKRQETKTRETAMVDIEKVTKQRGREGTFIVHVQYRQHATWQGQVVWAEKNKAQKFRSVLELLKLIDDALETSEEPEEEQETIASN
jgi:hypothetical protein